MDTNYNIMMLVCEDDKGMKSSFFHDIYGLLNKNNKIPINIIYYSEHYYGNLNIKIEKDTYTATKIPKIIFNYSNVKKSLTNLYKTFYVKGKQNILYYGGHSTPLFTDAKYGLKTNIFENIHDIELIILDSCYTSYTNLLSTIIGKTNYVMACSTSSPNLGFLSDTFIDVLNNTKMNNIEKYKTLINMFIKRNSSKDKKFKNIIYRTDASLIDMKKYMDVYKYIQNNNIKKKYTCKIENTPYYCYYDLLCLIDDKNNDKNNDIKDKIKECVIYKKMNKLAKIYFNKKKIKLSGIIIGIK